RGRHRARDAPTPTLPRKGGGRSSDAPRRGAEMAKLGIVEDPAQQCLVALRERIGAPPPRQDLAQDRRKGGDAPPLPRGTIAVAGRIERLVALDDGADIGDE